ncbi:MAG: hypothetical protein HY695_22480 [Deltaproteobacteria bacterium]|nr:hypothetical protein [Deltaproteobacteria bacterium]
MPKHVLYGFLGSDSEAGVRRLQSRLRHHTCSFQLYHRMILIDRYVNTESWRL